MHIGTSGWSYDDWSKRFYPKNLKSNKWIIYYSKHFNTVELNMSFYRFPSKKVLEGWYKKLPADFKMTVKASRRITHFKKLKNIDDLLNAFYKRVSHLKDKLGCILFQLPPSLKYDKNLLNKFLENLDNRRNNVIEFRDESWWNKNTYSLLEKYNTSFCVVSGLDMPDDVKITSNLSYFRFHGPYKAYASKYSESQLKKWAQKIKKTKNKCGSVYCYFNNDFRGYAVKNAKKLKDLI